MNARSLIAQLPFVLSAAVLVALTTSLGCAESLDPKDVPVPTAEREGKPTKEVTIDFEQAEMGKTPDGFTTALTGGGGPAAWVIEEDASAPAGGKVLAQTSTDDTNKRYPLCVYDSVSAKDVTVTVGFKPVSGEVDQAAGIVWRYQNKDNYYVVRANALEDNVVLYKTQDGVRSDLKVKGTDAGYGVKAEVPKGRWSTLSVMAAGDSFVVSIDGKPLFEVVDQTFTEPGKVGLWTKADSVTRFDKLVIQVYDDEGDDEHDDGDAK